MGELERPRMANELTSSPGISPTATRHAFVIGCSAPVAIAASTFPPQGLSLQPLQTQSPPDVRDRSPQRPHALALAEGRPHPHARPRMRRRGARRAARGRRTRSSAWKPNCDAPGASAHESFTRSGAAFSSESRPRQTSSGTGSPHEARGVLPHWAMTRGRRVKGAPGDGVGAEALETPAPWGVSRRLVPRRRRTRLLDRGVSGGLGSKVFGVILLSRHRRRHGPQHGKQAARARRSPRTHARYAKPASRPKIPCSSSPPSHEAARAVATQA
jgi:hypothetical protein